jgi:NAD(P)-dependent dehydrogenase (short-subunit alcohol dehydrogenase family)
VRALKVNVLTTFHFSSVFLENRGDTIRPPFRRKSRAATDGANPIGRAVALQLALQGSYVITAFPGLKQSDVRAIDELYSRGTLAGAIQAEVTTSKGAAEVVEEVERTFGRLDLLVNCLKFPRESSY